jgi:hypothetical protein
MLSGLALMDQASRSDRQDFVLELTSATSSTSPAVWKTPIVATERVISQSKAIP